MLQLQKISIETAGQERVTSVSMELSSGQVVFLLGANGSGKTSLLKGLLSYTGYNISGKIILNGEDITTLSVEEKAQKNIFFSPQHSPNIEGVKLISLIHGAYTRMSSVPDKKNIIELRKEAIEIAQKFDLKSELLDREVGVGLSGGEKKQSELLQLLVLKPKFCLLDEIDSGVDVDTISVIAKAIKGLQEHGSSILLVSHNMQLLDLLQPDKVYVLKNGKMVSQGGIEVIENIKKNGF